VNEILTIIKIAWTCGIFGLHDWTCAAAKGIKPTKEHLGAGVEGFKDYARMYCQKCGTKSKLQEEMWRQFDE
jgi:hypothetical protein